MTQGKRGRATGLREQVVSAVRWNALLPLKIVLGSVASIVLFNGVPKEEYGVIVLVTSLAGLLGTWIDMGIERSLPKFYPEVERDGGRRGLRRFITEISLFKLAVVAVLVVAMLLGRDWFFGFWSGRTSDPAILRQLDEWRWWLFGALVALLVLGAVFDVQMQVLVAYFRQRDFNLINMAAALVQPLLVVSAVAAGFGLLGIMGALVLVPVLAICVAWRSAGRAIGGAGPATGPGLTPGFYRRLAAYSLTNYGQQLVGMLHSFQFAVLYVTSLGAAAEFKFGFYLPSQTLQFLFAPMSGLQVPLFARLREEQTPERTAAVYAQMSRAMLLLVGPAGTGLMVLTPNVINLMAPQYTAAAPIALVTTVSLFLASALAVARNVLMVHEVYAPVIVSRLVGTVALPLLFWLPGWLGPLGAALAIGAASLGAEIVAWAWATRRLKLRYPWRFAGKVVLACLAMAAAIWPLAAWPLAVPVNLSVAERLGPALAGQLALVVLGVAVFLLVFRRLGGLEPADRDLLLGLRLPGGRWLRRVL